MNKSRNTQIGAGLIALSFFAAGPASASDSLPTRAATALGVAIAAQGDIALAQIRKELKDTVVERIQPFLPERPAASETPAQDATAKATR
ncbi:MAG TPA: hypothetical protein VM240_02905 [Verrucomicrobiae bacterium]|nr:hypothetical protein [Verrucomicrobiae bacterium]